MSLLRPGVVKQLTHSLTNNQCVLRFDVDTEFVLVRICGALVLRPIFFL